MLVSMCEEALHPLQEGLCWTSAHELPTTDWCPTSALSKLTSGAHRLHLTQGPSCPPFSHLVGGHVSNLSVHYGAWATKR